MTDDAERDTAFQRFAADLAVIKDALHRHRR
jgi:hypothetical protein